MRSGARVSVSTPARGREGAKARRRRNARRSARGATIATARETLCGVRVPEGRVSARVSSRGAPDGGATARAPVLVRHGEGRHVLREHLRRKTRSETGDGGRSARRPIGTRAMATKNKPRGAKSVEHRTHLVRVQSPTRGLHRRGGGPAGHSPLKLPGRQHPRARRCARTPREQSVKATPRVGRPVRAAYDAQSDDTAGDRNRPDDRTAAPRVDYGTRASVVSDEAPAGTFFFLSFFRKCHVVYAVGYRVPGGTRSRRHSFAATLTVGFTPASSSFSSP